METDNYIHCHSNLKTTVHKVQESEILAKTNNLQFTQNNTIHTKNSSLQYLCQSIPVGLSAKVFVLPTLCTTLPVDSSSL